MTTRRETDAISITTMLITNMNENFNDYGTVRRFNTLISDICVRISKYVKDHNILDVSVITYFMNFLLTHRHLRYNSKPILSLTKNGEFKINDVLTLLENIADFIPLNEMGNLISDALCICGETPFFIKLYSDKNMELPEEVLEKSCEKGFSNNIREIYNYYPGMLTESYVNYIISNTRYNDDTRLLYELLSLKHSVHVDSLKQLMINNMLGKNQTTKLFKTIVLTGIKIDNDILEYACRYRLYDIMEFLLSNDIKPTKQCFTNTLQSNGYSNAIYEKENCIQLLVKYGYVLTYSDFLEATRNKLTIKNLEKYNFKITQDFLTTCSDVGFYPNYGSIIDLVPDSICIENECKRVGNLEKIKKLVSMGCKITAKAVENACEHKNNLPTLRYLLQNGGLITTKALINMANSSGSPGMLLIAQQYEIQDQKREHQRQQDLLSLSVSVECPKNSPNDPATFYVDYEDENSCDDEESSDYDSDNTQKFQQPAAKQMNNTENKQSEIITTKNQTTYDLSDIKVAISAPNIISVTLRKAFPEKEKLEYDYLNLRRKIYEYLHKNSLFNLPTQKNVFMLDKKLSDLSSIKQNSYIKFEDLDKFVTCMISKNK